MWISKKVLLTAVVGVIAAMSLALAAGAFAGDDGGHHGEHKGDDHGEHHGQHHAKRHAQHHAKHHGNGLIEASLAPSLTTDPAFHGVQPGGAPWVLRRGDVEVEHHELELSVRGLVIPNPPGDGTAGPVKTISASLYCGADADTTAADTSKQVPLSSYGDARIHDRSFHVPATCLAPVILVHPNGSTGAYIALTGRR
jgi:hypothetical protein